MIVNKAQGDFDFKPSQNVVAKPNKPIESVGGGKGPKMHKPATDLKAKPIQSSKTKPTKPIEKDFADEQTQRIKEAFKLIDTSNEGFIDEKKLFLVMKRLGYNPLHSDVKRMIENADLEGSGRVTYDDFIAMINQNAIQDGEEIKRAFYMLDADDTGGITFENLKKACEDVGENLTDDEILNMIDQANRKGDGAVSLEEFYRVMWKAQ